MFSLEGPTMHAAARVRAMAIGVPRSQGCDGRWYGTRPHAECGNLGSKRRETAQRRVRRKDAEKEKEEKARAHREPKRKREKERKKERRIGRRKRRGRRGRRQRGRREEEQGGKEKRSKRRRVAFNQSPRSEVHGTSVCI